MKKNYSSMKTPNFTWITLVTFLCCSFASTTIAQVTPAQTKTLTAVVDPAVWATGTWTNGLPITTAPAAGSPTGDFTQLANTIPLSTLDNTYYSRRLLNQASASGAGAEMRLSSSSAANTIVIDVFSDVFYNSNANGNAVLHQANATTGTKFLVDCNIKINNTFSATAGNRQNVLRVLGHVDNVLEFGPNSVIENTGFGALVAYPQLGKVIMNGEIKGNGNFICGIGSALSVPANTGYVEFGPTSNNPNFNGATNTIVLVASADVTVNTAANATFFKNTLGGKIQSNNITAARSTTIRFNNENVWNSILRSSTLSTDGLTGANVIINADQTANVGAIEMVAGATGAPVINLTVAAGKSVTFGDSALNVWGVGSKFNIYGFDAATSIKFGTGSTALTSAQLAMIDIKDGASAGQTVGLDATGKLVLAPLSTKDNFAQFGFKSYPNPASNFINLSAAKSIDTVSFFNVLGQKVQSNTINAAQKQVDISILQKGVYMMEVTIENAKQSFKIVKQ